MADLKNLFLITKHPSTTQIFLTSLFFLSLFLLSSSSLSDFSPSLIVSSFTSRLLTAANFFSSPSSYTSSASDTTMFLSSVSPRRINEPKIDSETKELASCDIFDGTWVFDDSEPVYLPGYCPFVEDKFNCFKNGRPDSGFLRHRWQPHGCSIPRLVLVFVLITILPLPFATLFSWDCFCLASFRFDGKKMLKMLRGKRVVFVGDSLNRNMWESLVCSLRSTLEDKNRVSKIIGKQSNLPNEGFYGFRFNVSVSQNRILRWFILVLVMNFDICC